MKRLRFYYFSGTGNARRVALWMAGEAGQLGADAQAHSIDFGALPEFPESGDHIGFVFPVHGFTTIAAMLHFVWNFPQGNPSVSVFTAAVTGGCRIGPLKLPVSVLYFCFARFFLAKLFFATSRCNACGLCAQGCPVSAIRMVRGRPFWTLQCESCMRCMNFCPQRAIQASQLLAALVFLYGSSVLTKALTALLQSQFAIVAGLAGGLAWLLSLPVLIGIWMVFYRVWFALLRWKPASCFFEYTTLTRWYRRYREPDTLSQDMARKADPKVFIAPRDLE